MSCLRVTITCFVLVGRASSQSGSRSGGQEQHSQKALCRESGAVAEEGTVKCSLSPPIKETRQDKSLLRHNTYLSISVTLKWGEKYCLGSWKIYVDVLSLSRHFSGQNNNYKNIFEKYSMSAIGCKGFPLRTTKQPQIMFFK